MSVKYSKEEVALLDQFANTALRSILMDEATYKNNSSKAVAHWAYEYADEMVKKRREVLSGKT